MNIKKILAIVGLAAVLALALIAGGWFVNNAYAQAPTQNSQTGPGACHNSQAVLDLLKISSSDLKAQRQAGKSLLDIATAQGVSEEKLIGTLINPIVQMHAWMAQNYRLSNADQMTQYMRDWITKDIRENRYGTMTDLRLFGGYGGMMGGGMMGNFNGTNEFGGMMGGWNRGNGFGGMMGSGNGNTFGGMMGSNGSGGMMGNW